MSAPTIPEGYIDEPDADDPVPPVSAASPDLAQVKHLLSWMRRQRFSADVIQLGAITLTGVRDHVPRTPMRGASDDDEGITSRLGLHPIYGEVGGDLVREMEKLED